MTQRPSGSTSFATLLLAADGLAGAAGLSAWALGHRWSVPVALCGGSHSGRQGAAPLWWAALGGLGLAGLTVAIAAVLCIVTVINHDDRAISRSGAALLLGLVAGAACIGGVIAVFGDAPIFCF